VLVTAVALLCGLTAEGRAETITRKHLDAGRVQYSGMDINGDEFPDSIAQDNIGKKTAYFLADQRRSLRQIDPLSLPEEERRFIPDVILEADLDGDEVRDLVLYNRDYLLKYADNAAAFNRILAGSIYLGHAGDTYRDLRGSPMSDEARGAVMGRARELVLRGPDQRP
jgi:hypothetical protein